jgi:hypothetical protein
MLGWNFDEGDFSGRIRVVANHSPDSLTYFEASSPIQQSLAANLH